VEPSQPLPGALHDQTDDLPRQHRQAARARALSLAGTATLLSAALAAAISPWLLLMTTGIGLHQLLLVATGRCPASLVVDRLSAGRAS
jgi:hypothetical protein